MCDKTWHCRVAPVVASAKSAAETRTQPQLSAFDAQRLVRLRRRGKAAIKDILTLTRPVVGFDEWRLLRMVRPYTMVPLPRLRTIWQLANSARSERLPGAFVECGSCNGGTGAILAHVAARGSRPVWLFDSFEGLPMPTSEDGEKARGYRGKCLGSEQMVWRVLKEVGAQMEDVHVVQGWFENSLEPAQTGAIALLHLDADWYESTRTILSAFYDRVVSGGFLLFDDYSYWEGCRRGLHDFLSERQLAPTLRAYHGGVWFRKP